MFDLMAGLLALFLAMIFALAQVQLFAIERHLKHIRTLLEKHLSTKGS